MKTLLICVVSALAIGGARAQPPELSPQEQQDGRIQLFAKVYVACAIKAAQRLDNGIAELASVADAASDKCMFMLTGADFPDLFRARVRANLMPLIVDAVAIHRRGPTREEDQQ